MQNLSKDNYFDRLMQKYPKAMELFRMWVDRYKTTVDWKTLFCDDKIIPLSRENVKFHDLPYELQYGVILRFFAERGRLVFLPPAEAGEWFENIFASIERGALGSVELTSPGANAIFAERIRQIEVEGMDVDHDKANEKGELTDVAIVLLTGDTSRYPTWWKKSWLDKALAQPEKIRKIWAGALLAADIDRIIEEEKLVENESK